MDIFTLSDFSLKHFQISEFKEQLFTCVGLPTENIKEFSCGMKIHTSIGCLSLDSVIFSVVQSCRVQHYAELHIRSSNKLFI